MCSTLGLHKKVYILFFGVVRLGMFGGGGGGGGDGPCFRRIGDCMGFQRRAG